LQEYLKPAFSGFADRGRRVELVDDYKDRFGNLFRAGQRGTIVDDYGDGFRSIDFDGYLTERDEVATEAEVAEGPSFVPWLGIVPVSKLRMLDC
jgi:hypothetical protein